MVTLRSGTEFARTEENENGRDRQRFARDKCLGRHDTP